MKDSTAAVVIIIALAVGGLIVASWNGLPITNPFGNKPITCQAGQQWDRSANGGQGACITPQQGCTAGQIWNGNQCVNQVVQGAATALYKITVVDAFSGATLGDAVKTTGVSVFFTNNLDSRVENLSITGANTASSAYLHQGDQMYMFVFSAIGSGTGYYPRLYKVTIGGPVMLETPVYSGATWSFVETQVGAMSLSSEATPYWIITPSTALGLYKREAIASLLFKAGTQAGSTAVSSSSSAATYTSTATVNGQTQTSTTFTLKVEISIPTVKRAWGEPIIVISSSTPRQFQARFAAMWVVLNNTVMSDSDNGPLSLGFSRLPFTSVSWKGYYMILNPLFGSDGRGLRSDASGNPGSITINIPMNSAGVSATKIGMEFWFVDMQAPSDVGAGSYNAAPTYYGAIGAANEGLSTTISAAGFSVSNSVPSTTCSVYYAFVTVT